MFICTAAFAQGGPTVLWENVYGPIRTPCTVKSAIATSGNNRTVDFSAYVGKYVTIYGHDGAGSGVSLKCLQGGSSVDVGTLTGCASGGTCAPFLILSNQKEVVKITFANTYFSCQTFTGTANLDVCPRF